MPLADTLTGDSRYTFTGQFLEAATLFARKARTIESEFAGQITEELRCEHRGLVSTAIMQCAAALETEAHEICTYGPGSHLGSNGTDVAALAVLQPLAEVVDDQETLMRYEIVMHLLGKPALKRGHEPSQSASLVVRLRNELIHYKSRWGQEMSSKKLFASLESRHHRPPPFSSPTMNFFPHRCLSAECAVWAVSSSVAYLEAVYISLGVPSRFATYRHRLKP